MVWAETGRFDARGGRIGACLIVTGDTAGRDEGGCIDGRERISYCWNGLLGSGRNGRRVPSGLTWSRMT